MTKGTSGAIWRLAFVWDVFFTPDKVHIESQLIRVMYGPSVHTSEHFTGSYSSLFNFPLQRNMHGSSKKQVQKIHFNLTSLTVKVIISYQNEQFPALHLQYDIHLTIYMHITRQRQ